MIPTIPQFIEQKYRQQEFRGSIAGVVLSIDISGFTTITERMNSYGREGCEILVQILNSVFSPLISHIHEEGGFIATFAGDAFTAIFEEPAEVVDCFSLATHILSLFRKESIQKTRFGDFQLAIKIGLASGNVEWGIIGTDTKKTYFFRGPAIDVAVQALINAEKNSIIVQRTLIPLEPGVNRFHHLNDSFSKLLMEDLEVPSFQQRESRHHSKIKQADAFTFLPIDFDGLWGEFRHVVSVFFAFRGIDRYEDLQSFAAVLIQNVIHYGGYLESINFDDKGSHCFVFFGAPVSYERLQLRGILFIDAIRNILGKDMRAGVTEGTVFSGLKGSRERAIYGVLGDRVNTAARLMSEAEWGEIFVMHSVIKNIDHVFHSEKILPLALKGKSELIGCSKLEGKRAEKVEQVEATPLIGRDQELIAIFNFLKRKTEEKALGLCYLYGEPGIGKSFLTAEVLRHTPRELSCYLLKTDDIIRSSFKPFQPFIVSLFLNKGPSSTDTKRFTFREQYRQYVNRIEELKHPSAIPIARELKRTESILAALVGISWSDSLYEKLNPRQRRENTIDALVDLIRSLTLQSQVMIIMEDLQWLDSDSQRVFSKLTVNCKQLPLVIFCTSRYHDDGTKPQIIADSELDYLELNLISLKRHSIREVMCFHLGKEPTDRLLDFIAEKSQGNPFVIEQFCLYLQENNLISPKADLWELTQSTLAIPDDITGVIVARIDRLSVSLRRYVQVASILGCEFKIHLLEKLISFYYAERAFSEDEDCLEQGRNMQIWHPVNEIAYLFRHVVLRDTVYQMQMKKQLRQLHLLAAQTYLHFYTDEGQYLADIAYHFRKAEDTDHALHYTELATKYALDQFDNDQAIALCRELLKLHNDQRKRIKVQDLLAKLLSTVGRNTEAKILFQQNREEAVTLENGYKTVAAEIDRQLSILFYETGEFDQSMERALKACTYFESTNDKQNLMKCYQSIAGVYFYQGRYEQSISCAEKILELNKEIKNQQFQAGAWGMLGTIKYCQGKPEEAFRLFSKKREISQKIKDLYGLGDAIDKIGSIYLQQGKVEEALNHYKESKKIAEKIGDKHLQVVALMNIGVAYQDLGMLDEALPYAQKHLELANYIAEKPEIARAHQNLGTMYVDLEKFKEAEINLFKALELFRQLNMKKGIGETCSIIAEIFLNASDYSRAQTYLDEAEALASELNDLKLLTDIYMTRGLIQYNQKNYEASIPYFDRAITVATKINYNFVLCDLHYRKGNVHFQLDRKDIAKKELDIARKYAESINKQSLIEKCEILLAKLYAE